MPYVAYLGDAFFQIIRLNRSFSFDLEPTPRCILIIGGEIMKISEVSQQTGFSNDTLRYYEKIGLIPPIQRTESGIRDYAENDLKRIEFIRCMRSAGIPIEPLIEYIDLVRQGDQTIEVRKQILIDQRDQLQSKMEEMQETLDLLNYKISVYQEVLLNREVELLGLEE